MFIDSDTNENTGTNFLTDDGYMNHPGFLGGTWWKDTFNPKKAEEERYNAEYAKQKSGCSYESGDSCVDLADCENYFQNIYNKNTGNSRVPKRARKAASAHRGKVVNLMNARDCDVQTTVTSSIDQSQTAVDDKNKELQAIRDDIQNIISSTNTEKEEVFNTAQGMINDAANKAAADKKQMYMIGGGVAAILLVVLILKK